MGGVFKILLIVVALWLGFQAMSGQGLWQTPAQDPEQAGSNLMQRTEERVRQDMENGAERREALLPD